MIERDGRIIGHGMIQHAISKKFDPGWAPFYRVLMISSSNPRYHYRFAIAVSTPMTGVMKGAKDLIQFHTPVFHDVNLAAGRPVYFVNISTQHPYGRPGACG